MAIALKQNVPSKHGVTAKKGNIFSSSTKKAAVLDDGDDDGRPLAAAKKPNLLDPPSEPAAASTSSRRPESLSKKPAVQQVSAPSSLAYNISLRPPPITPAQAPNSASKAASATASAVSASASTSTSEQTQYYKPSPAETAALARAKQAASSSSSSASTSALKDDYVPPSKPVQLLKGPKMAINLGKATAKSGLSARPNALQNEPTSTSSTSTSEHTSTSTSLLAANSASSSRGSGKGLASKRNVFGDSEKEPSPPYEQVTTSRSKGKQRAIELDKSDVEQKKSRESGCHCLSSKVANAL